MLLVGLLLPFGRWGEVRAAAPGDNSLAPRVASDGLRRLCVARFTLYAGRCAVVRASSLHRIVKDKLDWLR